MCVKYLLIATFILIHEVNGFTEKQLTAAVKVLRNVCQPKTKATNEDIDKMHKGDWDIDHTAMCFMQCALSMYKLIGKDNTFDLNSAVAQVKTLPESLKEYTTQCIDECKDSAVTTDDKCIAGYEIAKCFYFCNPEKYFFP